MQFKNSAKLKGLSRIQPAFHYSMAGFKAALTEPAIRLELWGMLFNFTAIIILGIYKYSIQQDYFNLNHSKHLNCFLIGMAFSCFLWLGVFLVEILNTSIESTIDYISEERHPLAKKAKDLASAAVFLALIICISLNTLIFYILTSY